jgi:hypothetical protein
MFRSNPQNYFFLRSLKTFRPKILYPEVVIKADEVALKVQVHYNLYTPGVRRKRRDTVMQKLLTGEMMS